MTHVTTEAKVIYLQEHLLRPLSKTCKVQGKVLISCEKSEIYYYICSYYKHGFKMKVNTAKEIKVSGKTKKNKRLKYLLSTYCIVYVTTYYFEEL